MNFFINGNEKSYSDYPDFLDSIIGGIPDGLLKFVTSASPELNHDYLILHFQFSNLPSRLTCKIGKVDWMKDHDKINRFREQVQRIALIVAGGATVSDLVDLDIEITPELKEWVSTENQRKYHMPLVQTPRRNRVPISYDQDFTMW